MSIVRADGVRALWKGFGPVAMRQLPYTCCKLVAYELCSTAMIDAFNRMSAEVQPVRIRAFNSPIPSKGARLPENPNLQ